jgi:hypothetical protein
MAEMSAGDLAKLAQNPVGDVISVLLQNNGNLNHGPVRGTGNILDIQPVVPISIHMDWNIITAAIVPVIWMPSLGQGIGSTSGAGDTVSTACLSPADPGKWIRGARLPPPGADALAAPGGVRQHDIELEEFLVVVLLVVDRDGVQVHLDVLADDLEDLLLELRQVRRAVAEGAVVRHEDLQPFLGDGCGALLAAGTKDVE